MIYILDNDPAKCAQMLDDKSLDKMIKDITQALRTVYLDSIIHPLDKGRECWNDAVMHLGQGQWVPKEKSNHEKWSIWARECKANYLYLVEMGLACLSEWSYRVNVKDCLHPEMSFDETIITDKKHKMESVINWARDHAPDLIILDEWESKVLNGVRTPFPLVMPKRFNIPLKEHYSHVMDNSLSEYYLKTAIPESYRNYYQAKLKQRVNKYDDECKDGARLAGFTTYDLAGTWTSRSRPEWLEL